MLNVTLGQSFDSYGGYRGIKTQKTDRWHTVKIADREWFVTPEGHGIFLLGINHISTGAGGSKEVLANLEDWNFNSGGYDSPSEILDRLPGFISVRLHDAPHWLPANRFAYTDVFSEAFRAQTEKTIREKCEQGRKYLNLIGYSLTDTPRHNLDTARSRRGTDWVSYIRQLPASAEGKRRYIDFLQESYDNNFEQFRTAYRLEDVAGFESLADYSFQNLELKRPAIRKDDEAFLAIIVEQIYRLTRQYFTQYHPGALLLSEKYKMHDHPAAILRLAGEYFDIISIQPGPTMGPDAGQGPDESSFDRSYWKMLYKITGKPVLITDHAVSFFTPEYPRTLWHQFNSEQKAAEFYDWYLRQIIAEPHIIGYVRCQYQSRYDPLRTLLKQGLLDIEGNRYENLCEQISKTNQEVYNQLYR